MKGHLHERDIPQVRSRCPGECAYIYNVCECVCVYTHVREDATVIKVVISLWWMSRDRFLNEFTLTATQVHIKARSSCITADRTSKRNGFLFSLFYSTLYIVSQFSICFLLYLSLFLFFVFSSCVLPRAIPRCSRVYPVSRTHGDVCTETTYKKNTILHVTTSYDTRQCNIIIQDFEKKK